MTGARYGASSSRPNNFSSFLRNELSSGAYGYQHLITTGSGPIMDGTHTDTQTHFYYRMKAEYVHISLMGDPNMLLVGNQYDWKANELDPIDFRMNETSFIELGFDYKNLSFEFSPVMSLSTGLRLENEFVQSRAANLIRFGLRYTGIDYSINFLYGTGDDSISEDYDYTNKISTFRLNFQKKIQDKNDLAVSLINKTASGQIDAISYDFDSWTIAGIYTHQYKERFYFSGLLGIEALSMNSGLGKNDETNFSVGVNAAIQF